MGGEIQIFVAMIIKYMGYFFILILLAQSCQNRYLPSKSLYPAMVGDISFDPMIDDSLFIVCDEDRVKQYHNLNEEPQFIGEKYNLINIFKQMYDPGKSLKESGMIRIRFIVNCKGQSGRFRILGSDYNYKEKVFDASITHQLLSITKQLKIWKVQADKDDPKDYYQYLIFKMDEGKIIEILP